MSEPAVEYRVPVTITDPLDALRVAWEEELRAGRYESDGPREYVYASGRRSCVRAMALDLLHPEDRGADSADALERMQRGKEREEAIVMRLHRVGRRCVPRFEVIEGQKRFEVKDRDRVLLVTGKTDCRLKYESGDTPIAEVKSGESFKRVTCLEDLDRSPWTRHALDQLLAYLFANNEPWGLFIIDRPGMPLFLRVNLEDHLERVEAFLRDARTAVDARRGLVALPAFTADRGECRRCSHFGKSCAPPVAFGEGVQVLTDPRLEELAETRERTQSAAAEHEAADKELKTALRGVELGLLGNFAVTGKYRATSKLDLPAEIRQRYTTKDPKGAFVLSIERVTGGDAATND
jgi:hypothetical protein